MTERTKRYLPKPRFTRSGYKTEGAVRRSGQLLFSYFYVKVLQRPAQQRGSRDDDAAVDEYGQGVHDRGYDGRGQERGVDVNFLRYDGEQGRTISERLAMAGGIVLILLAAVRLVFMILEALHLLSWPL